MDGKPPRVLSRQQYRRVLGRINDLDCTVSRWMSRTGHPLLRYTLGVVFLWFGLLKPLGLSPVYDLVANTAVLLPPEIFVTVIGWWEVTIGLCLLYRPLLRLGILLLFIQIPGTFIPLAMMPDTTWLAFPIAPTVEGQYIIKNLVLIGAALVVGSTARGEGDRPPVSDQ